MLWDLCGLFGFWFWYYYFYHHSCSQDVLAAVELYGSHLSFSNELHVNSDLLPLHRYSCAVNHKPGCKSQNESSAFREVICSLCLVLVRPHLEYCVRFGALCYKGVQRRAAGTAGARGGLDSCVFRLGKRVTGACLLLLNYSARGFGEAGARLLEVHSEEKRGNGHKLMMIHSGRGVVSTVRFHPQVLPNPHYIYF